MLGTVEQPHRRLPRERPEPDKDRDIDPDRRDETGGKRQPRYVTDARHLRGGDPKPRNQPADENRRRAAAFQELGRSVERGPETEGIRCLLQGRPANGGEDFTTDQGAKDGGQHQRGHHRDRVDGIAGDRDPGDDQKQIARRKRDGNAGLLDEDEPSDDGDQQVPAEAADGGH